MLQGLAGSLGKAESALGVAGNAPLPAVADVIAGGFLSSLLDLAANATGLADATGSFTHEAKAAGVPGNFTQVRVVLV